MAFAIPTILLLITIVFHAACGLKELEEPNVLIQPLRPKGFKVSIPHQDGITLFAFHGKLNVPFDDRESGQFNRDITQAIDGRWTFVDKTLKLLPGNTIYYWIYVDVNDGERTLAHTFDGSYVVSNKEFIDDLNPEEEDFTIPPILIEPLNPKGLRASIPHVNGIKLFAFHLNVNQPMNGKEAGHYNKDIKKQKDGRWTFVDKSIKLKKGDTLYYWYYVLHTNNNFENLGYEQVNKMFKVANLIYDDQSSPAQSASTTTTTIRPTTVKTGRSTTLKPGCEATPTKINGGKSTCKGKLLFEENFPNINQNKWQKEIRFADEPDYEYNSYTDNPSIIYAKKNYLYIKPRLADEMYGLNYVSSTRDVNLGINCTGEIGSLQCVQKAQAFLILPPVVSARINTLPHFSFKYGLVEIRAKLPRGDWIYPELVLQPKIYHYGSGYKSGQIKIAFLPGNAGKSSKLSGGAIFGQSDKARAFGLHTIMAHNKVWNDDFHVFSVKWTPDSIKLYVDDEIYANIEPPEGGFPQLESQLGLEGVKLWKQSTKLAPFDQEMVLAIGVGVGGHMFPDEEAKPWINNDPKGQKRFYSTQSTWKKTWSEDSMLIVDSIKVYAI